MTNKEELNYLVNLLAEACRWRVDPNDHDHDPLQLEIQDRIDRLTGEEDVEGDFAYVGAKEPKVSHDRNKAAHDKFRETHVRVNIDGKVKWCLKSECHMSRSKAGRPMWVLNEKPVDKLSDELWLTHEESDGSNL